MPAKQLETNPMSLHQMVLLLLLTQQLLTISKVNKEGNIPVFLVSQANLYQWLNLLSLSRESLTQ